MRPEMISVGEVLFDVFDDVELLAGAPLNVTVQIHRLGHSVAFMSGVGRDEAGDRALAGIQAFGLSPRWIVRRPEPTGRVEVKISNGEPSYCIARGVAYENIVVSHDVRCELSAARPSWIYFGTLAQCFTTTRETTANLFAALPETKRFYDVNLRAGFQEDELILELLKEADVVKLNHLEMQRIQILRSWPQELEEDFCRRLASAFDLQAVCVTRGAQGAGLLYDGDYVEAAAPHVEVVDTVGAGDAFAAALLHGLSEQWEPARIVRFGNALGSLVASRRGAIPDMSSAQLASLMHT